MFICISTVYHKQHNSPNYGGMYSDVKNWPCSWSRIWPHEWQGASTNHRTTLRTCPLCSGLPGGRRLTGPGGLRDDPEPSYLHSLMSFIMIDIYIIYIFLYWIAFSNVLDDGVMATVCSHLPLPWANSKDSGVLSGSGGTGEGGLPVPWDKSSSISTCRHSSNCMVTSNVWIKLVCF